MKSIVWSKPNCPQCTKTKQLLDSVGIEYVDKIVGEGYSREDLLNDVPTAKSVPQIFLDGLYIGGHNELIDFLSSNGTIKNG